MPVIFFSFQDVLCRKNRVHLHNSYYVIICLSNEFDTRIHTVGLAFITHVLLLCYKYKNCSMAQ